MDGTSGAIGLPARPDSGLLMISGDQMRVLDSGIAALAGTPMADAIYCRRGASFASMRRVRLEPAALAELWERF